MAFRPDIYIDWYQSPRIIWVSAPSANLSIQDLHDTCSAIQDSLEGAQFPDLISSAGKEDLGGSIFVGLTSTLQNAQVAFEPRFAALTSGTVTTQDTNGVTCIAAAETYISDGVVRGSVTHNHLDGSHATVLSVDSETQLTSTPLQGGSDNNYDIGDTIIISEVVQCNISGGNLVAVDDVGASIDPVFPTYGTQIVRTSSSSATLQELDDIKSQSFLDATVYINTVHGTAGTVFPRGTPSDAVNNYADARSIADFWGFQSFNLHHALTLTSSDVTAGTSWFGHAINHATISLAAGADTDGASFNNISISGAFNGDADLKDCWVGTSTGFCGSMRHCSLVGDVTWKASCTTTAVLNDCRSQVAGTGRPTVDINGAAIDVNIRNYVGGITFAGQTQAQNTTLDILSGTVEIASSCTAGTVVVRGDVTLIDNSGAGCTVVNLSSLEKIRELWQLQGLDSTDAMTVTPTSRKTASNGIDQVITGDGVTTSTVTRQ